MSNLKQVRTALVTRIADKCGIDAKPYVPDTIVPPLAFLGYGNPPISFGGTLNEQLEVFEDPAAPLSPNGYRLQVVVAVSRAITEDAQRLLDELIDQNAHRAADLLSVPDAIMWDNTLEKVCEWCLPIDVTQPGLISIAGQDYFHAMINVQASA